MKLKVLFVIDGLISGGKERQLIEILRNFDHSKFDVGVVTFNDNQHYTKQAAALSDYYKFISKRPFRIKPLFTIWKCYREFKPDIVHTWDSLSSFYSYIPSKYFHTKIIDGSIRDSGVDKGWEYYFKRFFLKRANLILSNSKAGLNAYNIKGQVIYNAIDTSRFLPAARNHEFNLMMTANFSKYKDHETFLKAAVSLTNDRIINNTYLLGEGPYKNSYKNWIGEKYPVIAHRFHFTGSVSNVEQYLAKCRIGILCSTSEYSEGLSNAILEYMAAGLVPIATDLGGSSEIIEDGISGYLIKPNDHHKIIELVLQLHHNSELFEQLKLSAMKTIEEKFIMHRCVGLLASYYESLMAD